MTVTKPQDWTSGQIISLVLFMGAGVQSMLVFWIARNDHDMKLLALGAALGFISGSSATASTLLVGKPQEAGNRMPNPSDMKPGATASITEAVAAPPVSSDLQ